MTVNTFAWKLELVDCRWINKRIKCEHTDKSGQVVAMRILIQFLLKFHFCRCASFRSQVEWIKYAFCKANYPNCDREREREDNIWPAYIYVYASYIYINKCTMISQKHKPFVLHFRKYLHTKGFVCRMCVAGNFSKRRSHTIGRPTLFFSGFLQTIDTHATQNRNVSAENSL